MHIGSVPKCTFAMFKMGICTLVDMHNCAFVDTCICAPELASLWMGKVVCSPPTRWGKITFLHATINTI